MYLKSLVKVPNAPGKLLRQKKADTTYVYYEIDRIYIPEKKNTRPKRVVIGKLSKKDPDMIVNFQRKVPSMSNSSIVR